jgi:hypothetical protein
MTSELELAFVTGVGTLLSSTALKNLYYGVEQRKKCDMDSVYNREERG